MNVHVNIERLVLDGDGFGSLGADAIRQAVQQQLTAQLTTETLQLTSGQHLHRACGTQISSDSLNNPGTLSTDIATSIRSAIPL